MVGFPQMFDLGSLLPPLPLALHATVLEIAHIGKSLPSSPSEVKRAFFPLSVLPFSLLVPLSYLLEREMPTHIGLITRQISRGGEREVRSLDKGENQIKVYDNKNVVCVSSSSSVTNKKCRRALLILGLLSST